MAGKRAPLHCRGMDIAPMGSDAVWAGNKLISSIANLMVTICKLELDKKAAMDKLEAWR